MKFNKILITATCLVLLSCTVEGKLADNQNRLMSCKDARDGEVFYFNTKTIVDVRIGFGAPIKFKIITTTGKEKVLSSNMEAYLKCTEIVK